jgi:hypothetical protein
MNEEILKFLFADFLLDPRVPKEFADESTSDKLLESLNRYFDIAVERKGYSWKKATGTNMLEIRAPDKYTDVKNKIAKKFYDALNSNGDVFLIENHPFFGTKCTVNSEKFIEVIDNIKNSLEIRKGELINQELERWGKQRFVKGLEGTYSEYGGFFDKKLWVDFYSEQLLDKNLSNVVNIPASDRIVSIDHNDERVIEIVSEARKLSDDLITANDLGAMNEDEVKAAVVEVNQIVAAFQSEKIRADRIYEFSKVTLKWIGTQAGGAIVGTMALALLSLIAAYLGFAT